MIDQAIARLLDTTPRLKSLELLLKTLDEVIGPGRVTSGTSYLWKLPLGVEIGIHGTDGNLSLSIDPGELDQIPVTMKGPTVKLLAQIKTTLADMYADTRTMYENSRVPRYKEAMRRFMRIGEAIK